MKFLIEFSQINLTKFRSFIKLCNKTFNKTGIIMTIIKNYNIKVAADPFGINEKFQPDYCETKSIEIYKYLIFIAYPLMSSSEKSMKNSTYNKLELKITKKNKNDNDNFINQDINTYQQDILTFRISKGELNKLCDLLHTNFQSSEQLTIKATPIPEFMKNTAEVQNYSGFLSIFDKPTNSIKSGILFKPIKKYYQINDYEDSMDNDSMFENEDNQHLGNILFSGLMKTKYLKKICGLANKNFNKILNIYNYKDRKLEEKCDISYFIMSYLNNNFTLSERCNYIPNPSNISSEKSDKFNRIYKFTINSELLLKMLKNFYNDGNNPDYIRLWSQGLVMKTNFTIQYNYENFENNNNNNKFFDNEEKSNAQNDYMGNEEETLIYMKIKAIYFFEKEADIIQYKENENTQKYNIEKKKFVMNLIKNSIDDKHEELNKSMDLSLDDIGGKDIYRDNSKLLFEEDEDEDENDNENENNEMEFNDVSEDDKNEDEDNKIKNKKMKNEKGKIRKKSRKKNKK